MRLGINSDVVYLAENNTLTHGKRPVNTVCLSSFAQDIQNIPSLNRYHILLKADDWVSLLSNLEGITSIFYFCKSTHYKLLPKFLVLVKLNYYCAHIQDFQVAYCSSNMHYWPYIRYPIVPWILTQLKKSSSAVDLEFSPQKFPLRHILVISGLLTKSHPNQTTMYLHITLLFFLKMSCSPAIQQSDHCICKQVKALRISIVLRYCRSSY